MRFRSGHRRALPDEPGDTAGVRWIGLLLMFFLPDVFAASPGNFKFIPPPGFEGPLVMEPAPGATMSVWTRKLADRDRETLIQVALLRTGSRFANESRETLQVLTAEHAGQVRDSIRSSRTSFEATDPLTTTLGGYPATKIGWKGEGLGHSMRGIVYSTIAGSLLVQFMIQGYPKDADEHIQAAVKAVEAVTFTD